MHIHTLTDTNTARTPSSRLTPGPLWDFRVGTPVTATATMSADGMTLYAGMTDDSFAIGEIGEVKAINLSLSTTRWAVTPEAPGGTTQLTAPSVSNDGNRLYVSTEACACRGFDANSGAELWARGGGGPGRAGLLSSTLSCRRRNRP